MAVTIEYDSAPETGGIKLRRSVALPLYLLALLLSFLSDGLANLAALIADDPR
jgi:hypothetical protein